MIGCEFPCLIISPSSDVKIMDIINEEETQFLKTLSHGRRMFETTVSAVKNNIIPGTYACSCSCGVVSGSWLFFCHLF